MKNLFTLIALGSVAFISADQYNPPYGNRTGSCPSCNNGGRYYQDQSNNGGRYYQDQSNNGNYQQDQRQNSQGYYQRSNQYDYPQQSSRNQSYDQNQQQGNRSYDRDQQRDNNSYRSQDSNNQRTSSDQEINKKIQDTLSSGWFFKGFKNVSFDVNNGNVNLRGSVDTLENKNKVEDAVRKIDGVRQVNNQIAIVKENSDAYSESQLQSSERKYPQDAASNSQDRQINAKIRDKLSNGWFSKGYETLVIRTANGVVVISGTIDKPEDVQKISDQIKEVDGVRSVNPQLTVKNR